MLTLRFELVTVLGVSDLGIRVNYQSVGIAVQVSGEGLRV